MQTLFVAILSIGIGLAALRSWRTMLPSVAARTLVKIFLTHGASAWVLDTYQCGGHNPRIAPVMPNV